MTSVAGWRRLTGSVPNRSDQPSRVVPRLGQGSTPVPAKAGLCRDL